MPTQMPGTEVWFFCLWDGLVFFRGLYRLHELTHAPLTQPTFGNPTFLPVASNTPGVAHLFSNYAMHKLYVQQQSDVTESLGMRPT